MPVAIPTYAFPRIFMVSVVMREETDIFTMLFPINTVLSIFGESEIIFSRITARLLPCSARDCIRILFTVVIAVSAEEKNEESAISIRIATAWKAILESKIYSLLLIIFLLIESYHKTFKQNIHDFI